MSLNTSKLTVVSGEIPDPPYPADTKSNGWKPEFDIDRIMTSDTWVLADDDERPWLLRVWAESWRSIPAGSMPSDRRMFARRIGVKPSFLEAHAEILLRGWVLHCDGNLYHTFISTQVMGMLAARRKGREKLEKWRSEKKQKDTNSSNQLHTSYKPVSNPPEQEQEQEQEQEKKEIVRLPRTPSRFEEFWNSWPKSDRKRNKADCLKIWNRRKLDEIAGSVITDVQHRAKFDKQWLDGFDPMPSTYLNKRTWEDGLPEEQRKPSAMRGAL